MNRADVELALNYFKHSESQCWRLQAGKLSTFRLPSFPYCFSLELLSHSLDGVSALGQQRLIQMLFGLLIGSLQRQMNEGSLGGTFKCTKGPSKRKSKSVKPITETSGKIIPCHFVASCDQQQNGNRVGQNSSMSLQLI